MKCLCNFISGIFSAFIVGYSYHDLTSIIFFISIFILIISIVMSLMITAEFEDLLYETRHPVIKPVDNKK